MLTEIQEVTAQTKHQNVIILHIYWSHILKNLSCEKSHKNESANNR